LLHRNNKDGLSRGEGTGPGGHGAGNEGRVGGQGIGDDDVGRFASVEVEDDAELVIDTDAALGSVTVNESAGGNDTFDFSGTTTLAFPGEIPFPANRYVIAKGDDRQLVVFWYSVRGRRVAAQDWMNAYLALDSLRLSRTDNAMIRMNTALQPGERPADAERRLLSFAGLVNPLLKNYIPL
jgi:hypothetical protein